MRSTPLLVEAEPVGDYRVHVRYENGVAREVDLSHLTRYGGVFEPIKDPAEFARLRADEEAGTIVWACGADIAPETLYGLASG